ncbi:MAG: acetyl-CoA carboxylase carboxyltransferase subunit beta [Ruminococcaceae bacterium]|nr:acetyl-CoA carboxylase carboxyltransferase subunit beta [Oscillospiraceae bacterium]
MALEDLFKVVKARFGDEQPQPAQQEKNVEIPEDLLFKCPRCGNVIYNEEFLRAMKVCPKCGYHSRLTWKERLDLTVDKGSFKPLDESLHSLNPIGFPKYEEKVEKLSQQVGMNDAIKTGECTIRGYRCVIGIMDSHFMMASMGSVVGEKIARAFEYATEKGLPVVMFTASGGARMQEGIISLMQMAKTSGAVKRHSDAGGLYITVMTDPTTGGVTASFASLGDVILAEPKVLIGFAGRRVIQDTIRQRLPDDFQSAEFLQECGFVDMIVERGMMRKRVSNILKLHGFPKEGTGR